ncbi:MAG: glycosyltransferase [Piscinibacter sp.]
MPTPTTTASPASYIRNATADAARAAEAVGQLRVLSTLPFCKVAFWRDSVQSVEASAHSKGGLLGRFWQRLGVPDPTVISRLLRRAPHADVVLINGGERADLFYLALAGLMPWIRAPHVIVDAHWQPGETRLLRAMQRLILRLGRRLLADVQIHSAEEIALYERNFGIPRHLLKPLPWSTSLQGYRIDRQAVDGDAIVTGGHSYRDYATLLAAVAGQPWELRIGLPASPVSARVREAAAALGNVNVIGDWTYKQYWQQVADSRVFAMPIVPGLQRCTADQTILNAMALGTIVVATDALSSRLYIRHGQTGFLVPEGDPNAWRETLNHVYALPQAEAQRIRDAARLEASTTFSEEERLLKTLERAATAVRDRRAARGRTRIGGRLATLRRSLAWWAGAGGVGAASLTMLVE